MEWIKAESEIKGACHLLNEKIYKRLARNLWKESEERIYKTGKLYACQELFRDAYIKNFECFVAIPKMKKACRYFEFIKVGEFLFKFVKSNRNQHFYYELLSGEARNG